MPSPEELLAQHGTLEEMTPTRPNNRGQRTNGEIIPESGPRPPEFSDESLALAYAEQYSDRLRFVAAWSRWFVWDGARWLPDETLRAFDLARSICRAAAARCPAKYRKSLASASTVAAVASLARADRRLAATVDQWDGDPWALNTPDGVVDLRTGMMREHRREDYMTKVTAVSPGGDCPLFRSFLRDITGGDDALVAYLKRLAGYALTGSTREEQVTFLHGSGANGKSKFIGALAGMLGDYHRTAPIEAFSESHTDRHPTELAMLRGARLVTASETQDGRRWAETRIKTLTGGDRIAARFMRQDFFEFQPTFKLVVVGNHKPGLRSVDESIRRRLHLVPFAVTIPPEKRDPDLGAKLKAEWPGILQWAIEGCLEWQRVGLAPPAAVLNATEGYLIDQDSVGQFVEERCVVGDPDDIEEVRVLYGAYKSWSQVTGEHAGSMTSFSQNLESRGFVRERHPRTRRKVFRGIRSQGRVGTPVCDLGE